MRRLWLTLSKALDKPKYATSFATHTYICHICVPQSGWLPISSRTSMSYVTQFLPRKNPCWQDLTWESAWCYWKQGVLWNWRIMCWSNNKENVLSKLLTAENKYAFWKSRTECKALLELLKKYVVCVAAVNELTSCFWITQGLHVSFLHVVREDIVWKFRSCFPLISCRLHIWTEYILLFC